MQEWVARQQELGRKAKFVHNKEQFDAVDPASTNYLFGLFGADRMQEETVRRERSDEPSLTNMTDMAIKILSKNPKGFYLFVEGELELVPYSLKIKTCIPISRKPGCVLFPRFRHSVYNIIYTL